MTSINPLLYVPLEPGYRLIDGALINAMNEQIIENAGGSTVGGTGFTLVNPPGFVYDGVTDNSLVLQNTLTSLGLIGGGATLKLLAGTGTNTGVGIYIGSLVEIPSNVTLDLTECPVVAGPNFGLSTAGALNELPVLNKPTLYTNIAAGATSFQIVITGDNVVPAVGDQFILRGQRQVTGKTLTKETGYIQSATDNGPGSTGEIWTIVPVTPVMNAYQVRYPNDAWEEANPGKEDLSTFTITIYSAFTGNIAAGSMSATVNNAASFNIGDYIYINDSETVGQATGTTDTNTIHNEVNRIIDKSGNTVYFQTALYHSYSTMYNGGITSFSGGQDVKLIGCKATFGNADSGAKSYSYKFELSVNCDFYDCELSYSTESGINYGPIGQAFRFQYSLNCNMWRPVFRGKPDPDIYGSGEGYAFVFVGSTNCKLMGHTDSNARHGVLLQDGTAGCEVGFFHSQGARISAIDTHGINARQNHVHDFTVVAGPNFTPDATQKAGIRIGNSSHTYGDFNNVIENGCIYNFAFNTSSSGANQGYGIDYVIESGGNIVRNVYVLNPDYGIHSVDNGSHPTFALGADNVSQDIIVSGSEVYSVYFDGGSSQAVGSLNLINVTSDNSANHFFLKNMTSVSLENPKIRNSINTSGNYSVVADNITALSVISADFNGANRGISFQACPNAQFLNNNLRNQIESVVFFDNTAGSTNSNGYVWEGNVYTGTVSPSKTTGGSTGTIIDYGSGSGNGTVTSVGFEGDGSVLSATESGPITTSGVLTASLLQQYSHTVLAGPSAVNSFGPIVSGGISNNGTGYLAGTSTYPNVPLTGGSGTGAIATIGLSAGGVNSVIITTPGSGYVIGDQLTASAANIGGSGSGFMWVVLNINPGMLAAPTFRNLIATDLPPSAQNQNLSTYISGLYYPAIPVVSFSSKTVTVNEIYAVGPFLAQETITVSKLGVNIITGITSTNVALGIYSDNGGFPGMLVNNVTGVTATATSSADAEVTGLAVGISIGEYYWIAANFNGAVAINAAGSTTAYRDQLTTSTGSPAFVCKVASTYTGALPTTFPSVNVTNFSTETAPHLWFRF